MVEMAGTVVSCIRGLPYSPLEPFGAAVVLGEPLHITIAAWNGSVSERVDLLAWGVVAAVVLNASPTPHPGDTTALRRPLMFFARLFCLSLASPFASCNSNSPLKPSCPKALAL